MGGWRICEGCFGARRLTRRVQQRKGGLAFARWVLAGSSVSPKDLGICSRMRRNDKMAKMRLEGKKCVIASLEATCIHFIRWFGIAGNAAVAIVVDEAAHPSLRQADIRTSSLQSASRAPPQKKKPQGSQRTPQALDKYIHLVFIFQHKLKHHEARSQGRSPPHQ